MEIRRWHCCLIINFALIIPYSVAKPFSLNKALAAELQQRESLETTTHRPQVSETVAERLSLNKALNLIPLKSKKYKATENIIPRNKKISSLAYRKTYQIRSPLKPKKLKYQQKLRNKRKNQSIKREINDNERFNKKYMPLLRNLGMLFDNLLTAESSGSEEIKAVNHKRNRHNAKERSEVVCSCTRKSDSEVAESKPPEAAVTTTTTRTEISTDVDSIQIETTTATTDNTSTGHISSLGQNTDVPLLFTRDTTSARRDDYGLSERSGPSLHGSAKGNFTRDNRNSEHNTGSETNISDSAHNEEHPCSTPRDGASSDEYRGRTMEKGRRAGRGRIRANRNDTPSPVYRGDIDETNKPSKGENVNEHIGREIHEFERENSLETRGDKTSGAESIPKFVPGFRRFVPKDEVGNYTESLQSKEDNEESLVNIASNSRVADGNGAFAAKDQKSSPANKAVVTIKDLSSPTEMVLSSKTMAPTLTIIDGYSVARDKNGRNKLNEKSIRFHS